MSPDIGRIRYWMKLAQQTLEDAEFLASGGRLRSCVNRLYYACLYVVTAYLALQDLSSKKHTGVRALFYKELVKTGLVSEELAAFYNDLFEWRTLADYADFSTFTADDVIGWVTQARTFVQMGESEVMRRLEEPGI